MTVKGKHRLEFTSEVKNANSPAMGRLDSILLVRIAGYVVLLLVVMYGWSLGRIIDPVILLMLVWLWGEFSSVHRAWFRRESARETNGGTPATTTIKGLSVSEGMECANGC